MRTSLIPLDMIFIGADGVVKNIHVNAAAGHHRYLSGVPVRFVLEIPVGGRKRSALPSATGWSIRR